MGEVYVARDSRASVESVDLDFLRLGIMSSIEGDPKTYESDEKDALEKTVDFFELFEFLSMFGAVCVGWRSDTCRIISDTSCILRTVVK